MEKVIIKQSEVKWCSLDNQDCTRESFHGYKPRVRKNYIGELYDSNAALCNKRRGVSNENETLIPHSEIEASEFKENRVCGSCLRIYKKLQP